MILIDSNVPMYLVGAPHSHKADAQRVLDVTDAEVLLEILHRYVAIDRRHGIQPAFDALLGVIDEVLPADGDTAEAAKAIVLASTRCPTWSGSRSEPSRNMKPPRWRG